MAKKLNKAQQKKLELMILAGLPRFKSIAYENGIKELESQEDIISDCVVYIIDRILRSGTKSKKGSSILSYIQIDKAGTYMSSCIGCRSKNKQRKDNREKTKTISYWLDNLKINRKY